MESHLASVRGTVVSASDPRDRYRENIARVALHSMVQFTGLLKANRDIESPSVVHRNGLRLLKLVNTLLDVARIEAGRIDARDLVDIRHL
jgi:signal transduction histidine kinase